MDNKWRYLEDDYCTASLGLATDEYITRNLSSSPHSHTLRLYTYGERCALVGKYQEVSSEIDMEYCKAQGIAINRRPTGGGAIIMGKGQLGVAIAVPLSADFSFLKLSMVFERYSRGILLGLERLGLRGEFKPRNDILVAGKKIAGLAFATLGGSGPATDAGLFHASLLSDLNEEVMQGALRIPSSKRASLTTVSRELGRAVTTQETGQAVKEGYQKAFGIELASEPLSQEERKGIESLEEARYKNPVWIFGQLGSIPIKTPSPSMGEGSPPKRSADSHRTLSVRGSLIADSPIFVAKVGVNPPPPPPSHQGRGR